MDYDARSGDGQHLSPRRHPNMLVASAGGFNHIMHRTLSAFWSKLLPHQHSFFPINIGTVPVFFPINTASSPSISGRFRNFAPINTGAVPALPINALNEITMDYAFREMDFNTVAPPSGFCVRCVKSNI